MLVPVLALLFSLISSTYANDDFSEDLNPPHRITLSKIVALQKMIEDEYPLAPPNTPISPIIRAFDEKTDSCFRGIVKLILTIGDVTIRILTTLQRH